MVAIDWVMSTLIVSGKVLAIGYANGCVYVVDIETEEVRLGKLG